MIEPKSVPVLILAGGLGTRLSEETTLKPKPMIEIGEIPILIHIMRYYYSFGFNDFVICAGYKSWEIKNYFINYSLRINDLELDHRGANSSINGQQSAGPFNGQERQEAWRVRVLDTGSQAMTGSRIAQALEKICETNQFQDFAITYGDGLCNVDLLAELKFHYEHQLIGTVLGVKSVARFGELMLDGTKVQGFREKPESKTDLISGGYFFFKKKFMNHLSSEIDCILERGPLEKLAQIGELRSFIHDGFWQPMDTKRDQLLLQDLWESKKAPWIRKSSENYPLL